MSLQRMSPRRPSWRPLSRNNRLSIAAAAPVAGTPRRGAHCSCSARRGTRSRRARRFERRGALAAPEQLLEQPTLGHNLGWWWGSGSGGGWEGGAHPSSCSWETVELAFVRMVTPQRRQWPVTFMSKGSNCVKPIANFTGATLTHATVHTGHSTQAPCKRRVKRSCAHLQQRCVWRKVAGAHHRPLQPHGCTAAAAAKREAGA